MCYEKIQSSIIVRELVSNYVGAIAEVGLVGRGWSRS